jgi:putative membrane protein
MLSLSSSGLDPEGDTDCLDNHACADWRKSSGKRAIKVRSFRDADYIGGLECASPNGDVPVSQSCEIEMDALIKVKPVAGSRDYLAEERTFLAWIRTAIALMGFGFVVVRFGIFGDEPQVTHLTPADQSHGPALWFGAALIAIGATVNLFAAWRFMRLVSELNRHRFVDRSLSKQGVIVALFLALLGIAMTIYLTSFLAQLPHALHASFVNMATGR